MIKKSLTNLYQDLHNRDSQMINLFILFDIISDNIQT